MSEFMDAIGPVFVFTVMIAAAYILYRIVLHAAVLTKGLFLDLERKQIDVQVARDNLRLVAVTQQATLVSRSHVEAGVLYDRQFEVLLADIDSRRLPQPVPASIHYAPHMIDKRPAMLPPSAAEPEQAAAPTFRVLSAMECFAQGMFADPTRLLFGFDQDNEPVYSPVEHTYGVAVAGVPGMGKTNLMRLIAAQMILHGAQIAIIDPHAFAGSNEGLAAESTALSSYLWDEPAIEAPSVVKLLRRIDTVGQARIGGRDPDLQPLLLLADEVTTLICDEEHGDEIKSLLLRINRNYRKVRLYVMGAGQDWLSGAQRGDTTLRNSFVCKAVCRIDRMNAGKLLPTQRFVTLAPALAEGQAIFVDRRAEEHLVSVPICPAPAVAAILGQNAQPRRSQVVEPRTPPRTEPRTAPRIEAHEVDDPDVAVYVAEEAPANVVDTSLSLDPQKLRMVKNLYRLGYKRNEILKELWGVDTRKGGNKVISAARELDEIIAYLMRDNANGR